MSKRMIPPHVDQFLCCGTSYRALRDAVAQVLLENKSDTFMTELQVRDSRAHRKAEENIIYYIY